MQSQITKVSTTLGLEWRALTLLYDRAMHMEAITSICTTLLSNRLVAQGWFGKLVFSRRDQRPGVRGIRKESYIACYGGLSATSILENKAENNSSWSLN